MRKPNFRIGVVMLVGLGDEIFEGGTDERKGCVSEITVQPAVAA
jgi:hypothetical protein